MENCKKYERQYFMPPKFEYDWVKKDYVDVPVHAYPDRERHDPG